MRSSLGNRINRCTPFVCPSVCLSAAYNLSVSIQTFHEVTRCEDCFCLLCAGLIHNVRRSLHRSVLQSLMSSLVLSRVTTERNPGWYSVVPASAAPVGHELVFSFSRYDHITPLLQHLTAPERIQLKLAVLVYKCRTLPMSSSVRLISRPGDTSAPLPHCRWLSNVHRQ